ncbi:uncharacterized protein An04g06390 [Aspergillus niger]|uniref:Contig An04c0190, genomic contig n=3 Tax=Aspergillus niger TaxID=5061 RepID=A2QJA7_ASPNC|nr:uncharacterized protein An04g06390 [Aspergillus niger]CAK44642.1 unnamed protein product [Aspergillus niger]
MAGDDDGHEIPAPGGGIRAGENGNEKKERKRGERSALFFKSFFETLVSEHSAYKASTMVFDQPGQAIVQSSKAHPDQVPVGPVHRKGGERMRTGRSDVERSRKSQPELVLMIGEAFPRVLSPGEWMWKWKLKAASTSSHSLHAAAVACPQSFPVPSLTYFTPVLCALDVGDVMGYLITFNSSILLSPHYPGISFS